MNNGLGWYPVGLAEGLERGTSAGTRLFGQELVIWRDANGGSHVWEDRCPHRGMRLSFGFVRENHIACLYHGWQYGTTGQCRYIPAHPNLDVPQTIRVRRFASAQRSGFLWAYWDAEESADEPPADIGPITPVRTLVIEAPLSLVANEFEGDASAFRSTNVAGLTVIAALQPLSASETAAHLAVKGDYRGEGQKMVAAWAQLFRTRMEAHPAARWQTERTA